MVNKKALLIVATALAAALILSSLAVTRTARSEGQTQANPDIRIFLQINGIPGESIDADHQNWIDIDAFNWSEAMASTVRAGGVRAGRVSMEDFHFVMRTNTASAKLFLAVATGRHIAYAELDCCTSGGEVSGPLEFLEFKFDDVIITSYNIAGSTPDYHPLDEFSIAFGKITMTYWPIMPDGTRGAGITAYYDLRTNSGG